MRLTRKSALDVKKKTPRTKGVEGESCLNWYHLGVATYWNPNTPTLLKQYGIAGLWRNLGLLSVVSLLASLFGRVKTKVEKFKPIFLNTENFFGNFK